jgi:acetylornithine deacetylase/succinyl-diaminopimelate desuccinylase-like protein
MADHTSDGEVVEVARRLIAAPSENPAGDERRAAAEVVALLAQRGVDSEIVALDARRPNVIARVDGAQPGRTLILCGHIDTKPAGPHEAWRHPPFAGVIADGRLYGLGAADMKGGVASIVLALGRLRRSSAIRRGTVLGVFTADEEAGSALGARHLAVAGLVRADAAIIAEPAGIDDDWQALYLGTRGSLLFRVDLEGARGHSSLEDHFPGMSATMAAARLMTELDETFRRIAGVAVNVGATVAGGTHYGVRPGSASFRGDVRFPPGMSHAGAAAILHETVERFRARHPEVRLSVILDELLGGPFEPFSVDSGSIVARACRAAAADVLGRAPADGIFPGGTDSFFLQGIAGIPTVPAFGPGCLREAHQPDEYVSLAALEVGPDLLVEATTRFLAA